MNPISRRQFLKLASGIGLGIAIAPLKLEAASTATLNRVWRQANQTPLLFDVTEYGTLSVANYPEPKTRREVFDISRNWNESPTMLAHIADSCIPLSWFVADLHREALEEHLDSIDESLQIKSNIRKRWGDSDSPEVIQEWLGNLKGKEFKSVIQDIDRWLAAEPNWTHEWEYFEAWADGQRAALNFFRGIDLDGVSGIHIDIVEGEHPGSTYYAAELAMDPEEANAIAAHEGIPLRFRRVL